MSLEIIPKFKKGDIVVFKIDPPGNHMRIERVILAKNTYFYYLYNYKHGNMVGEVPEHHIQLVEVE